MPQFHRLLESIFYPTEYLSVEVVTTSHTNTGCALKEKQVYMSQTSPDLCIEPNGVTNLSCAVIQQDLGTAKLVKCCCSCA
jgi:hypothetical protein